MLFADLVGSTSFGEQVDAESAREAMAEYHAMATTAVEGAGGTIAKFIGDGVMALFGVRETAEDDADRAVAAGLALQAGFAPIRHRVARRHGVDLGLRVGINTGEIVLADGDADVVGDAINTAARLEAACAPGQVLVGEDTWRLTRSHVRYDVLGEVAVKGKDGPVATFQVADDAVGEDDQATPFVGRAEELARLRKVFDEAVDAGAARLATVIGAPGVGKTRIAREFADSLGAAAVVADLRCERAGTATFAPIADLLRTLVPIDDDADPDLVRAQLHELVAELDDADRVAHLLAGFVGAAPAKSTEEAFLAVRRLVETTGRRRPLVVVVDDIQWAEPLFLDLLEHLADWVRDAPAVLIGLARPELREIRPSLAEESHTLTATIGLEGLDADATAELAAKLVGAASLPGDLIERLPASTEGNPLFVRELMRMLVDDGVIEPAGDGWQLTIDADAVEVPPTIQSLLAARLDRMPADERRLVELASVVGPEFALGAVAVLSEAGAAELRLALERLRRRELVESTGMYWGDEPIYRFHHVLIRDAAYRRLLKRARADLHRRVGEWTEHTAAGLPGEHEVAIAYHFEQSHEYHRQLDDVDDATAAVGRRAAELFGVAAERALERDDLPAAAGLAERSLVRLDDGDALIPSMLVVAAEALLGLGDVGRGRPVVDRLAAVVGDDERLSPWAVAFAAQLTMLTEPDRLHEADEQADRAAGRLAEMGDEAGVAKARLVRAGALARLGRIGRCEAELDLALSAARSAGDRRRVAAVLGAAPVAALWGPSPIPRAGGRCLDVIRLLRITTGSPAVEATSVRCQAVLEALRGRFDTARSMLADSRATVEELGLRHALNETDLYVGIVELLAGEPVAAEGPLRTAHRGLGQLGIGADAGQAAAHLARAVLQQGRVDEAVALAAESAELAGENPQTAIAARTAQAEILAAQGRYDEAVAVASEAVARAEGTDIIVDHAAASAVLARVAALAGDGATSERAAQAAADLYEQKAATVAVERAAVDPTVELASSVGLDARGVSSKVGAEMWNEADRLSRAAIECFFDPARGSFEALLAPDLVSEDRRPILGYRTGSREQMLEMWSSSRPTGTEALTPMIETVASRGDHLVLYRLTVARGTAKFDLIELGRLNGDGLFDLVLRFDVDQLAEAIDELDRLYLDSIDPSSCEAFQVRVYGQAYRALRVGELDRAMDLLSERYVQRDHRALGWPAVDWTGMRERLSTMGSAGDLLPFLARIHRSDGPVGLCRSEVRVIGDQGAEQIDRHLLVSVLDLETGQAGSVDQFSLDQMDEAERKFAELVGEVAGRDVRWNPASLAGGWLAAASRLDRGDLGADLLASGTVRPSDGHRRQVLAVRGDRLALVARVDAQSVPVGFVLEELDEAGRLTSMEEFAPDDLIGAAGRCDRRWLERTSDAHVVDRLLADYLDAWRARDIDRLQELIDEEFRAVDRRPLGNPEFDKEQQLAAMESLASSGDVAVRTHDWYVCDDRGVVAPFAVVGRDDDQRLTESMQSIVVCVVRDGRILRNELFPIEQRERAIERFDEVTGADRSVDRVSRNEADRLTRRFVEAFTAGAREEWLPMLSPDQVTIDRRPLVGVDTAGADAVADAYPRDRESGELSSAIETIAVRGETFALVRWRAASTHGREWDGLHLTRWTADGLNDLNVIFPPDQLTEAVAELDRLYLGDADDPTEPDGPDEPRTDPQEARHEPWNEADRLARLLAARFFDMSSESWSEMLDPEHVSVDRRPIVAHRLGGRDANLAIWTRENLDDDTTSIVETIATRGEQLALHRWAVAVESGRWASDALNITRWNERGLVDLVIRFGPDQIGAAVAELERLYEEYLDGAFEALQLREFSRGMGLLAAGDVDGFIDLHDRSFVMRDHRQLGWPDLDLDGYRERLDSIMAIDGEVLVFQERVLRLDHTTSTCAPQRIVFTAPDGTQQVSRSVMVMVMDPHTGLITRMEQFDEDEQDAAVARFDELMAERGPVLQNEASRRMSFVNSWLRRGDAELVAAVAADGATFQDAQGDPFEPGAVERREVMAVRGERLALVGLSGPGHAFVVEEFDAARRLSSVRRYSTDRLRDAVIRLEQRWIENEGAVLPRAAQVAAEFRLATLRFDRERLDALISPDHVLVEHRAPGDPNLSREQALDLYSLRSDGPLVASEIVRTDERADLLSGAVWEVGADGQAFISERAFIVGSQEGGRITRLEFFADDAPDSALRRFDELIDVSPPTPEFWNDADRLSRRLHDAFLGRSSESWYDLLDPDHVSEDRRPIVGYLLEGRDATAQMWSRHAEEAEATPPPMTMETIAARGDDLVLHHIRVETGFGDAGGAIQLVGRNQRDLCDLVVRFEPGDLAAATAELDRRWFASLNERRREVSRLAVALGEAWVAPSSHSFDGLLAVDFEFVDGRTLGMGSLDRAGFEAALRGREVDGAAGVPEPSRVMFVADDVMVFRASNLGHSPDSGVEWEEIACNVLVADGDRIARLEMFDEDHWDDALVRAEELIVGRGVHRCLDNMATQWADRVVSAGGFVDLDAFSEDFVREDRRSGAAADPADRLGLIESLRVQHELGATYAWEPIAVRGARFALGKLDVSYGDNDIWFLTVTEVVADGRARRMVHFDPDDLAAAQNEVDRLYLATLPDEQAATLRPGLQFRDAMSSSGTAVMSVLLSDDFRAIDHRDLAFPELDRDGFLEINRQRDELFGEALVFTTEIHRIEGDAIVASNRMAGITPDSGVEWLHEFVNIFIVRDGQLHGLENFGPDEVDAAMARAGELAQSPRAHNAASRLLLRLCERWNAGEPLTDLLSDDFVRVDRRPVVGMPDADRDEFEAVGNAGRGMGARWPDEVEAIHATHGDRFALTESDVTLADDSVLRYLTVLAIDADGLLQRVVLFEPEQRGEAMAEFDRLVGQVA